MSNENDLYTVVRLIDHWVNKEKIAYDLIISYRDKVINMQRQMCRVRFWRTSLDPALNDARLSSTKEWENVWNPALSAMVSGYTGESCIKAAVDSFVKVTEKNHELLKEALGNVTCFDKIIGALRSANADMDRFRKSYPEAANKGSADEYAIINNAIMGALELRIALICT